VKIDLTPYPSYKDSGLPWLGEVPEHWGIERAKWLFRKMDRPVSEGDEVVTCFRDGVVTLRRNRRVRGFTESLKEIGYQGIHRGDLVIHGMDAFAGAVGVADSDGKGTPVYSVCQPRPGADAHYYAYVVGEMARSRWILALAKGIRERSTDFRFEGFAALQVPVPPPSEQAAIFTFLRHVDHIVRRYVRARHKLIVRLEEEERAIIDRAVTGCSESATEASPLGDARCPNAFMRCKQARLGRVCESIRDGTHNPPPAVQGVHRLLSVRNIVHGRFVTRADDRTMSPEAFEELQRSYTVRRGDVVLALVGATTGKSALVEEMEHVTVQRSIGILRPDRRVLDAGFLNLVLRSSPIQNQIRSTMKKYAAQPGIYLEDVGRLQVIIPGIEEQQAVVREVGRQIARVERLTTRMTRSVELLQEYRTRLFADCVTGKVDVREAAANMPDQIAQAEAVEDLGTWVAEDEVDDEVPPGTALEEVGA